MRIAFLVVLLLTSSAAAVRLETVSSAAPGEPGIHAADVIGNTRSDSALPKKPKKHPPRGRARGHDLGHHKPPIPIPEPMPVLLLGAGLLGLGILGRRG